MQGLEIEGIPALHHPNDTCYFLQSGCIAMLERRAKQGSSVG